MYPFIRLAKEIALNRRRPPLAMGDVHVTHLRAWPFDIDPFLDLNNGRILTLMDLGRMGYFVRAGIPQVLKQRGWYGTVAGTTVRYRKRITAMQKIELRTRLLGWDHRFIYFDQAIWRVEDCCAHAVIRTAITTGKGFVPPGEVAEAMGYDPASPLLPDWILAWDSAEKQRPWPPER